MEEANTAPAILVETVGIFETNCYFVYPKEAGTLYIIDPGGDPEKLLETAASFRNVAQYRILLTHAHVDHISGAGEVAGKLGIPAVFLHPADLDLYRSPENALLPYLPPAQNLPPTQWPPDMEDFTILTTPGHTPGGVCYYFQSMNALFSGDTLFSGSVGRTDLPGGDYDSLMRSIHEKLLVLPEKLAVFPGHGDQTTIGIEKSFNPYLAH